MTLEEEKLLHLIKTSNHIVFFGGAGVSTESGIKDFRSKDGLYQLHSKYGRPYEEMLSHTYFMEHTDTFYQFYHEFMINTSAKPNYAHQYLAKLEKEKDLTVVTQNIDGLHQKAGSKKIIELHGSILRNRCMKCNKEYSLDEILKMDNVPICPKCNGVIKPIVTLYEEPLEEEAIYGAIEAISNADLLIVAGTSLRVYPASGMIRYFKGKHLVVINKDHLDNIYGVELEINAPVGETFKHIDQK